jgi:thiamine transport system ATP-binding protein
MSYLEWKGISKSFGAVMALRGVDLSVEKGQIMALLGPSGCGKTTFLRVTAGLEAPDEGRVMLLGSDLSGVPVHRRGIGFMFQDYNLFPHLKAGANVGFGLRMAGWNADKREKRIREMFRLVRLEGLEDRRVHSLSGGEQQRIALARSLAPSPALLMLDEPLGALDAVLRDELLEEIPAIVREAGVTAVYVTHDQREALAVCDRVALMRGGRVVQAGDPRHVVRHPANAFAASFLKLGALVPAAAADGALETAVGRFEGVPVPEDPREGYLLIRPTAIVPDAADGMPMLRARIGACTPEAGGVLVSLELGGNGGTRCEVKFLWNEKSSGGFRPVRGSETTVGLDLGNTEFLSP